MAVLRPDLIVKSTPSPKHCDIIKIYLLEDVACIVILLTENLDIVPIVMAGIIGIYGLVVSVLVANDLTQQLPLYTGFIQLGAGLSVGLAGLAAG